MDINLVFVLMTMLSNVGVQFAPQLEAAATFDPTCNAKVVKQEGTNYGYDSVEHCLSSTLAVATTASPAQKRRDLSMALFAGPLAD